MEERKLYKKQALQARSQYKGKGKGSRNGGTSSTCHIYAHTR